MKKYMLYIIIVILVAVIAVGGTYIFMEGKLNNANPESSNKDKSTDDSKDKDTAPKKSGVELVSTKEEGNNIVQTFNAYMNGKTVPIKIKYTYKEEKDSEDKYAYVEGFFDSEENNLYHNEAKWTNSTKEQLFNISKLDKDFNENNFKIIKGLDNKDYLLVISNNKDGLIWEDDYLYIYNDNLKIIDGDYRSMNYCFDNKMTVIGSGSYELSEGNPWYSDQFEFIHKSSDGRKNSLKIVDNEIHYLIPVYDKDTTSKDHWGTLEERIYTISNDKLNYTVSKTYSIIEAEYVNGSC